MIKTMDVWVAQLNKNGYYFLNTNNTKDYSGTYTTKDIWDQDCHFKSYLELLEVLGNKDIPMSEYKIVPVQITYKTKEDEDGA